MDAAGISNVKYQKLVGQKCKKVDRAKVLGTFDH